MNRRLSIYVLAAALLLGGAVAFGVPVSSLWILAFVVGCALMMIFMMAGMRGGNGRSGPGDGGQSSVGLTKDHKHTTRRGH